MSVSLTVLNHQAASCLITTSSQIRFRRPLEHNDVWIGNPDRSFGRQTQDLQRCICPTSRVWRQQSITYDTSKRDILMGGIRRLIADVFLFIAPFTSEIYDHISDHLIPCM